MIEDELRKQGARPDQLDRVDTEWQGVRRALEWATPGDFLFLPIHADRDMVLRLMRRLENAKWKPGERVPVQD